ncbi:hypothetical protein ASPCAL08987 [Aspergillus calidoustus]|uniref:Uncharacterized protein n=1 Tax=Aspergillus calidoustus TaxID=454130 RepID=A0A0U5GT29_ASPCI|nr:hypothetical protein ASPCAL08987 [Aspergillus calidoustus]
MAQCKAPEQPIPIPATSMADLKIQSPDARPASRPSMQDLNGTWVLETHLSSNIPLLLKLQKIPFLIRHAITSSPVHLILTQYTETNAKGQNQTHLDLVQRTAGSLTLPVIQDKRVLDWIEREHEDFVFGKVLTRSVFVRGNVSDKGVAKPDFEVKVHVKDGQEVIERFLRGEIDVDGSETGEFLVEGEVGNGVDEERKGLWVHTLEINEKSAWTAETVWGFEMVKGERYLTSRVVVVNGKGKYQLGRMVFRFLSREV